LAAALAQTARLDPRGPAAIWHFCSPEPPGPGPVGISVRAADEDRPVCSSC
jgi:hypothetical protein